MCVCNLREISEAFSYFSQSRPKAAFCLTRNVNFFVREMQFLPVGAAKHKKPQWSSRDLNQVSTFFHRTVSIAVSVIANVISFHTSDDFLRSECEGVFKALLYWLSFLIKNIRRHEIKWFWNELYWGYCCRGWMVQISTCFNKFITKGCSTTWARHLSK